jgi:hypothetical protein
MPACAGGGCGYACDSGYTACNAGGTAPACLLTNPNTTAGVFVAPGGSGGSCGSESQPCGTIAEALAVVASSSGTKNIIYLSNGTYTEQVTLPAGVTIQGGWFDSGGSWTHLCNANAQTGAVIQAPAGGSSWTVTASFASVGSSTLDTLTIQSVATALPGQSLYGIIATGSATTLTLNNVDINVAAGGAGAAGTGGASGAAATAACTGSPQSGLPGNPGSAGTGAPSGTYSASGYTPSTGQNGGVVTAAAPGQCGSPPGPAQAGGPLDNPCTNPDSTGCEDDPTYTCTSKAGTCGAGGAPGGPGTGGVGGGSSIGVFVWGAKVTITGSAVGTGNGGAGGTGGTGGTGGAGYQGPNGANSMYATSCTTTSCHKVGTDEVCLCTGAANTVCALGGAGTTGGAGGNGGNGGGGNGGDSYCWYAGGAGSVTATPSECSAGSGGAGGTGGATTGATGNSGHVP